MSTLELIEFSPRELLVCMLSTDNSAPLIREYNSRDDSGKGLTGPVHTPFQAPSPPSPGFNRIPTEFIVDLVWFIVTDKPVCKFPELVPPQAFRQWAYTVYDVRTFLCGEPEEIDVVFGRGFYPFGE